MKIKAGAWCVLAILVSSLSLSTEAAPAERDLCRESIRGTQLEWKCDPRAESLVISVSGPDEFDFRQTVDGDSASFQLPAGSLDGDYSYHIALQPRIDPATRALLAEARGRSDEKAIVRDLRNAGRIPAATMQFSGTFLVAGGSIVEKGRPEPGAGNPEKSAPGSAVPSVLRRNPIETNQLVPDNLYVQGWICVGIDCADGEGLGVDTIRMKENNLRLHVEDTSTSAGYASNDWRFQFNDQDSGGASYLGIQDATAGTFPIKIEPGTNNNTLYVAAGSEIGVDTSAPAGPLHLHKGDTPFIRFDQSGGQYTAWSWDAMAHELFFGIRDVTAGSTFPLKVRAGGSTDTFVVNPNRRVGIGNNYGPDTTLHVRAGDGVTQLRVQETSGTSQARDLLSLYNNGRARIRLNESTNSYLLAGPDGTTNSLNIYKDGDASATRVAIGSTDATSYALHVTGDIHATGNITSGGVKAGIVQPGHFSDRLATVTFTTPSRSRPSRRMARTGFHSPPRTRPLTVL
jgi:hypothetical protein